LNGEYNSGSGQGDIELGNEMNGSPDVKRFTAGPAEIELRGFGMNAPNADGGSETDDVNQNEQSQTDSERPASEIRARDSYIKGNSIQF